jgi:hypothetical protein
MNDKKLPCPTMMRLLVSYSPQTGQMVWSERKPWMSKAKKNNHIPADVVRRFNQRYGGKPALSAKKGNGYLYGNIYGVNVLAHRVAWCVAAGAWPSGVIDHINGKRNDNRIENLRDCTVQENNRNRISPPKNAYYGITKNHKSRTWHARIKVGDKNLFLGAFKSERNAAVARFKAEQKHWKTA